MYTWKWFFSFGQNKTKTKQNKKQNKKTLFLAATWKLSLERRGREERKNAAVFSEHFRVGGQGDTGIPLVFISAFWCSAFCPSY